MIYFAQTNDNAYIKIGYASSVKNRLAALGAERARLGRALEACDGR